MAISNELSSDIATALLAAREKRGRNMEELKQIVFKVHFTLQRLTEEARRRPIVAESFLDKGSSDH